LLLFSGRPGRRRHRQRRRRQRSHRRPTGPALQQPNPLESAATR